MNEQAYYVDTPWTWRDRLRFKLFPSEPCPLPDAPALWQDVLVVTTVVHLSAWDRIRLLVTGRLKVQTKTVTENTVGGSITGSIAYPTWRGDNP